MIGGLRFEAYAVTSRHGPHVTLQAGVEQAGRYWTTTTRHSVKAASVARSGHASVTIADGGGWRIVGGETAVIDPAHPTSFGADPWATAFAGTALVRLGLGSLDQLLGYAEAGAGVPPEFLPMGRVLLVTRARDDLRLAADSVPAAGRFATDAPAEPAAGIEPSVLARVPPEVADLIRQEGRGWLGVTTPTGAVALPARWVPGAGALRVTRAALATVGAVADGPVCITLDDSASRRPDEKLGLMLRGQAIVADAGERWVSIGVDATRVTYWQGFDTDTVGEAA